MAKSRAVQKWEPASAGAKDIEDLSFTGRDERGFPIWWAPEIPRTQYGHAHEALGMTYAFEFLGLINCAETDPESTKLYLGFIAASALRNPGDWRKQAVTEAFFSAIGRHLIGHLHR